MSKHFSAAELALCEAGAEQVVAGEEGVDVDTLGQQRPEGVINHSALQSAVVVSSGDLTISIKNVGLSRGEPSGANRAALAEAGAEVVVGEVLAALDAAADSFPRPVMDRFNTSDRQVLLQKHNERHERLQLIQNIVGPDTPPPAVPPPVDAAALYEVRARLVCGACGGGGSLSDTNTHRTSWLLNDNSPR